MDTFKRVTSWISTITVTILVFCCCIFANSYSAMAATIQTRISGQTRYETSAKITEYGWKQTSDYAVIATGENFPDALCATPLAKKYNAPIILTNSNELNASARYELTRLKVKTVFIIGGTGAVSQDVEKEIKILVSKVDRIYGSTRYETSEKIAERLGTPTNIVLATGNNFPDAMSIAPIAAMKGMPILLTDTDSISDTVKNYINKNNSSIAVSYVVGGNGVISNSVKGSLKNSVRLSGNNRYDTNTVIINKFKNELSLSNVYIATGQNFPDALACSALAPTTKSPILLIDSSISDSTQTYLSDNISSIGTVTPVGGTGVIPDALLQNVVNSSRVTFKDSNLESAVRTALNKTTGDLIKNDVIQIKRLDANNKNISDLSGIENLINLQTLSLYNNYNKDISVFNKIIDLTPLQGLTMLESLDLGNNPNVIYGNQISDITPLKNMKSLTYLSLLYNKISNITPLEGLDSLRVLNLGYNRISDITPLNKLSKLNCIALNNNLISNITPLKDLTRLETIYLMNNQISDISSLKNLTYVQTLCLEFNPIADISCLKNLPKIAELTIDIINPADIAYFTSHVDYVCICGCDDKDKINVFPSKINAILSKIITPNMSIVAKERAIHDYIINNAVYDENWSSGNVPDDDYTAKGILLNGKGVCQGYAEAFALLCNFENIPTIVVGSNSLNHAWNIVKLDDGNYYQVDVTWDDDDNYTHRYFNISDTQMFKDHPIDPIWNYPACNIDNPNRF